ncbi:MAG TPA: hypothetical protein VNX67_07375 [Solirubrobacteraceae bacterium]|nr:hypothetical protein [Solirubrobacteraceae bacterium]
MRSLLSVAAVSALALVLAVWSSSAMAGTATTRPFVSSLNGSETPQGSLGEFITDVAIDESSGHVYVANENFGSNRVVDVFGSSGKYLFQLDGSNTPQGSLGNAYGVAVDNSAGPAHGDVYVSGGPEVIYVFDPAGKYLYQFDGSDNPDRGFSGIFPGDLKVDANGDLFIATGAESHTSRIYEYKTTASSASYFSSITIDSNAFGFTRDEAGNFYVGLGAGNVDKLDPAGNLLSLLYSNHFEPALAIDPSSGDLLVDDRNDVLEYGASGALVRRFAGTIEGEGALANAIAVDTVTGDTYVANAGQRRVNVYGPLTSVTVPDLTIEQPSASYFSSPLIGTINPQGVTASYRFEYKLHSATSWSVTTTQSAGNGTSAVPINVELPGLIQSTTYDVRLLGIATETGAIVMSAIKTFTTPMVPPPTIAPVSSITDHSATFSGSVNPQGVSAGWHFEYSSDDVNWVKAPAADESAGSGTSDVPVTVSSTTLDPNTTYHVRLVTTYLGGSGGSSTSQEVSFTTNAIPPAVTARSAFPVTDTAATLRGLIDPEHAATTYWFEYGPADCASNPCASVPATRDASAGATLGPKAFATQIEGLKPETTYHFRLLAKDQAGTTSGADGTLTTVSAAQAAWPARGIELVNSPEKANQPVFFPYAEVPGGFDDSHAIWDTASSIPTGVSGLGSRLLATRTSTGWQSENVMPNSTYEDLIEALAAPDRLARAKSRMNIQVLGFLPSSGTRLFELSENQLGDEYGVDGYYIAYARVDSQGRFQVVFTMLAGEGRAYVIRGQAATEDLNRLFIDTSHPYDPVAHTAEIYEISDGTPRLVSQMPDGTVPLCEVTFAEDKGFTAIDDGALSNAPGQDQLVFFASRGNNCSGPTNIYVRDVEAKTTQLISGPPLAGDPEPANGGAHLLKISHDGRSALFTTEASLVAGDDADGNNEDSDVYRWTQGQGVRCLTCVVPQAGVKNAIASDDLSHVYFTSPNQLVAGKGAQSPSGYENLYVYHDGQIDYVSRYSNTSNNDIRPGGAGENVELTPDGHAIFFESIAPNMTPDDPGACGTSPCLQVYRYDANDRGLECVTCRPAGAPPGASFKIAQAGSSPRFGGASDDGRTFIFDSSYPLLPEDVNGTNDLYEWHDGRLRLVTDGLTQWPEGPGEPELVGVTPDGADAFFTLGAHLTGYEVDQTAELYDARIGGGFPPPLNPPAPCSEDACQGPLAQPPALEAPGSASFDGPANHVPVVSAHPKHKSVKPHHAKHKPAKPHRHRRRTTRARHSRTANHHRGGAK